MRINQFQEIIDSMGIAQEWKEKLCTISKSSIPRNIVAETRSSVSGVKR